MAGYTSRFFLTLTIPSVFGFFSVLWLLRRKRPRKSVSKAIQVENSTSEFFEDTFLASSPMKLKSEEETCEGLKETETSPSQNANGIEQNGALNGIKKGKSKSRENSTTCSKSSLTNGNDKHHPVKDKEIELTNGIEAMDLNKNVSAKDEILVNANNKTNREMEISNDTNSSQTTVINGQQNGSSASEIEQSSAHLNVESAKDICDNDVQVSAENNSAPDEKCKQTDDIHEHLTLPEDCSVVEGQMPSPEATYCDSVGSYDSGRGPSENPGETYQDNPVTEELIYEFDILQELVGLLIGKQGRHVRFIKERTNADIVIKRHPYSRDKKICAVSGTNEEINAALKLVRKRFPAEAYPSVTLSQIMPFNYRPFYDIRQLSIPDGVPFEACVCATVSAGHFFVQQPTHPSFHSLPSLTARMRHLYSIDVNAPTLPLPNLNKNSICVAEMQGGWFRAVIDEVSEEADQCRVKFLDYGGYSIVPRAALKQIRYDLMCVPFQASECYLADVVPVDGEPEWSSEAKAAFEELAQGQILQCVTVAYDTNRVPYVRLYKVTGADSVFINKALVERGVAMWVSP